MIESDGPETPETFVSTFFAIARKRTSEALHSALDKVASLTSERTGFGRGANYTVHRSADRHANASACIEPVADGWHVILSAMRGARAEDAAGRVALLLASALFPTEKAPGKKRANAKTKERRDYITATLGLHYAAGVWSWNAPEWDALRTLMPEPIYGESTEPKNARAMFAFFDAKPDGTASEWKQYRSLRKDGSDFAYVQSLYSRGILFAPVKAQGGEVPDQYYPGWKPATKPQEVAMQAA